MNVVRISSLHSVVHFSLSKMPVFSVLIPAYNRAHLIHGCIQSVLCQSYPHWEIIVVDDGSSDDLNSVISRFCSGKIRLIRLEENQGVGAAFRQAADAAGGDILGMLGSDDALTTNALEIMVNAHLRLSDCSLITSSLMSCDSRLKPTGGPPQFCPRPSRRGLIDGIESSSFATFKRSAYKRTSGFNESMRAAVDHDIYLKLEDVGNVGFVDIPVYMYRVHDNTVSQGEGASRAILYDHLSYIDADERRKNTLLPRLSKFKYHYFKSSIYLRRAQNLPRAEYWKRLKLIIASKYHRIFTICSKNFST